jgi:thymidylate synthase
MKLVILRSEKTGVNKQPEDHYLQECDTHYADRVIGNLRGEKGFCTSCATDCINCREPYQRNFGKDIVEVLGFPSVLPYILENPLQYVPKQVPRHDILLVVGIHEQILIEFVKQCKKWGTKGVVVPLEGPDWITHSGRAQAQKICEANGIEISFPKPFCAFKPPEGGVLAQFRRYFGVGFPEVELTVKNDRIVKTNVKVSGGCGSTYYIARWLLGKHVDDDLEFDVLSKRLHSYPCTASMERDPELNDDTCLHIAGQAHREILLSLKGAAKPEEKPQMVLSPIGKMVQKAASPSENLKNIEDAKSLILSRLQNGSSVTLAKLRKAGKITPAAIHSALLLLKQEGRIKVERTEGLDLIRKT